MGAHKAQSLRGSRAGSAFGATGTGSSRRAFWDTTRYPRGAEQIADYALGGPDRTVGAAGVRGLESHGSQRSM